VIILLNKLEMLILPELLKKMKILGPEIPMEKRQQLLNFYRVNNKNLLS